MKRIFHRIARRIAVVAAVALLAGPALAFTREEATELRLISASLSAVHTMRGDFVQFGPTGERTQGQFYLERPGRIRFEYDPPNRISVVSDGKQVLVHDKGLRTYDLWPLKRTPLKFLLDDRIDLSTAEQLAKVYVEPDVVQVVLVDDSRFGGGSLFLFFDRLSYELRQWTVIDQQGLETTVAIYNIERDQRLDRKLFEIDYSAAAVAARERN